MDVVLTAPNGWEINQQQRMRTAAQQSTLVKGAQSGKRVRFVSEAEVQYLISVIRQDSDSIHVLGSYPLRHRKWLHW
jgi:hypothetical protein